MPIQVKICGITTPGAAEATLRAGAEFGGLVFHPKSPRHLSLDQARSIATILRHRAKVAALFVNPDDHDIETVRHAIRPDLIQLHGHETHARVHDVVMKFGIPVIKAIGVATAEDVVAGERFDDVAEYLLFDAKGSGEGHGGLGMCFDWTILSGRTFRRPWLLAGGLTAENVAHAIQISGAQMVDVSTGVEDAPGVKNPDKIMAFVAAARAGQTASASA